MRVAVTQKTLATGSIIDCECKVPAPISVLQLQATVSSSPTSAPLKVWGMPALVVSGTFCTSWWPCLWPRMLGLPAYQNPANQLHVLTNLVLVIFSPTLNKSLHSDWDLVTYASSYWEFSVAGGLLWVKGYLSPSPCVSPSSCNG